MIYLDYLLAATGGVLRYSGPQTRFDAFSHDSRQIAPGELFVAVRGERGDGHDYLLDAARRGAGGLLVEAHIINAFSEERLAELERAHIATIVVDDTRLALQRYARAILERWRPIVIAVAGSVGKTSTKEAIATVLSSNFATFKSWQNYNDLLGLPLSLGRLEERHEYAVLELGCDHPGEIAALCRIAQPRMGLITNISPVQLQYFGSVERLAAELITVLTCLPDGGHFFLNLDDKLIESVIPDYSGLVSGTPAVAFDVFGRSLVRPQETRVTWDGLICVFPTFAQAEETDEQVISVATQHIPLTSHLLGEHHVETMLAAYKVGLSQGIPVEEIRRALATIAPLPGRLNPLPGVYGSRLLDDTHNATPASVRAGLAALKDLPAGRRIAILGDMLNLGEYEQEAHRGIGREAARSVDYLITRGERAALIAEAARQAGLSAGRIVVTSTHEDTARAACSILEYDYKKARAQSAQTEDVNDVVLIKGSEETRMERVTELLMVQPARAPEQLVRQTPGWKQIVVTRPDRPTWVEIDLGAIGNNTRQIKELVGPRVQVLASLKADAYGHGALKVARTVLHNGASMLGVATVSEATPLREAGISAPILVFGYVPYWQMREAVHLGVTVTLYASESAQALSRAALALGKTVRVHVKIDTGMARLGMRAEQLDEIVAFMREVATLPGLELEGIYTHFAAADSSDQIYTLMQLARFQRVLHALEMLRLRPPIAHAANSAATLSLPAAHLDMVRPGIALYGLDPSPEVRLPEGFRAALSFKTQVAQVKLVPEGESIGYGCAYTTTRPTLVAVLPVGYADGFRRAPNNWGSVLIHGQPAPILGRVCMDQCMVDVTAIPQTRMGDEVVLIGQQGQATLTAEEVAQRLGTINYEVVSEILARVPRVD
jgi:alanine racemase